LSALIQSIRNCKKIMFGTSIAWATSHLSQQTSEPAYYIVDCRIFDRAIGTRSVGRVIFADTLSLFQLRGGNYYFHHIIDCPSDFQTFLRFCFVDRADYANKYSPQGNYFTCIQHLFTPFAFKSTSL
jgi:hypothetical protein